MATKLTKLTHKVAIQLYLVAEGSTICISRSKRPGWKLLDTPSYTLNRGSTSKIYQNINLNRRKPCSKVMRRTVQLGRRILNLNLQANPTEFSSAPSHIASYKYYNTSSPVSWNSPWWVGGLFRNLFTTVYTEINRASQ
jgi:hypothetical protein